MIFLDQALGVVLLPSMETGVAVLEATDPQMTLGIDPMEMALAVAEAVMMIFRVEVEIMIQDPTVETGICQTAAVVM